MRATALEFRQRMLIMTVILALGFWSPWLGAWQIGPRTSLLEWLALNVSRLGILPFSAATPAIIVLVSLIAAVAAILRVWGSAWLGSGTVGSFEMRAGHVVAGGPYRYVRNPLYLGTWGAIAAVSFLMPPSGALLSIVLISVFLLRLILAEEAFLTVRLGDPYTAYRRAVPRLIPRLRSNLPPAGRAPHWGRAVLSETNALGIFLVFAILSWRYNNALMLRAILINFGISLVIRAFLPGSAPPRDPAL